MNTLHQTITDQLQCNKLIQAICTNSDIRNLTGYFRTITDSNTDISR